MSENSKISWTDHTFNIAWGCEEVSPACDHCYAKSFAKSVGHNVWNENPRRTFGEKHWNEPIKWDRKAREARKSAYVFCSSMCDIFEVHPTIQQELKKLPPLIERTPNLIWLLLTKRWNEIKRHPDVWKHPNARMGVTVESQDYVYRITPDVSWVSAEPLLGDLSLQNCRNVDWVIVGGESGAQAREMKLDWALRIIEECRAVGMAVHFKQTGDVLARKLGLKDRSGKDPSEWPEYLGIREYPA